MALTLPPSSEFIRNSTHYVFSHRGATGWLALFLVTDFLISKLSQLLRPTRREVGIQRQGLQASTFLGVWIPAIPAGMTASTRIFHIS